MNIKYEVFNDDIFNKYELLRLDAYGKDIFCNCKNYFIIQFIFYVPLLFYL